MSGRFSESTAGNLRQLTRLFAYNLVVRSLFECWDAFRKNQPPLDAPARREMHSAISEIAKNEGVKKLLGSLASKYSVNPNDYDPLTVVYAALLNCREWRGEGRFLALVKIHFLACARETGVGGFERYIQYSPGEKRLKRIIETLRVEKRLVLSLLECAAKFPMTVCRMAVEKEGFSQRVAESCLVSFVEKLGFSVVFEIDDSFNPGIENLEVSHEASGDIDEETFIENVLVYSVKSGDLSPADREFMAKLLGMLVETADSCDRSKRWKIAGEALGMKPKTLEKKFSRFVKRLTRRMEEDRRDPDSFF